MHINSNLYPKEGFFFQDSDGVQIRGDTWPGVIQRVKNYRKRAGLPPGNPDEEVIQQACKRNPGLCKDNGQVYNAQLRTTNLKTRILQWFLAMKQRMQSDPIQFSFQQDANNRSQICSTCPFNKQLPGGCASCRQAVEDSRKSIIGGRAQDARVHACDILAEDINTTRWFEMVRVDNPDLPGHCWRKKVL